MNSIIYAKVSHELENRRADAKLRLQQRETEVYSKIPEIEILQKELSLTGIRCAKKTLTGDKSAIAELDTKISQLGEKIRCLLIANKYPENYLKISYTCSQCNDTGFISQDNTTEKCTCFKKLLINYLYKDSNIKINTKECFIDFDPSLFSDEVNQKKYGISKSPRQNILGIKEKCSSFVKNFNNPEEKSMFFTGPVGTGKTFMLNCIACELFKSSVTVLYVTAPTLFDVITDYKRRSFMEVFDETAYKKIFSVDLLIIDDLGTESHTSSRYAELLNILNTRELNNASKPCKTIISTNMDVSQLAEFYTERVESRIIGSFSLIKFAGDDIRKYKKLQKD